MSDLTVNPSGYNTSYSSYSAINSSYPIGNAYTNTSSTTYAYMQCKTGSNTSSYISLSFNLSSIPDDAVIESVSCEVKARVSSTTRISTATAQLYYNNTAKGSSVSVRSTTATTYSISNTDTWAKSELSGLLLRFTGKRGTSQTSNTAGIYIYGANLTITYELNKTKYTVTVTASGEGSVDPTGSTEVYENDDFTIDIYPNDGSSVKVTDNNVDVTNQLTQAAASGTSSSPISGYTTSGSISGTYYTSAVGNGSDTTSTTTNNCYCSSSGSTADINYSFDLTDVPSNATITSVTCSIKGHCESTSASTEVAKCQLYSGTTTKSNAVSFTTTSNTIISLTGSNISRSDLDNLILKFTIGYYGGLILGATLVVEYELGGSSNRYVYISSNITSNHTINVTFGSSSSIYLKLNGQFVKATKVYKKVNNAWTEIDAETLSNDSGNYLFN